MTNEKPRKTRNNKYNLRSSRVGDHISQSYRKTYLKMDSLSKPKRIRKLSKNPDISNLLFGNKKNKNPRSSNKKCNDNIYNTEIPIPSIRNFNPNKTGSVQLIRQPKNKTLSSHNTGTNSLNESSKLSESRNIKNSFISQNILNENKLRVSWVLRIRQTVGVEHSHTYSFLKKWFGKIFINAGNSQVKFNDAFKANFNVNEHLFYLSFGKSKAGKTFSIQGKKA